MRRRSFDLDDLDDHHRRTIQLMLDQINAKFEHFEARFDTRFEHFEARFDTQLAAFRAKMISRKEAWGFLVLMALLVTLLP